MTALYAHAIARMRQPMGKSLPYLPLPLPCPAFVYASGFAAWLARCTVRRYALATPGEGHHMAAYDDDAPRGHLPVPGERAWQRDARSAWHYTPALGEGIAREYCECGVTDGTARDGGLWGLHAAMPDTFPPPSIVSAWERQYPAFGTLMREARALRAQRLMEETLVIADTAPGMAPRVALMIAARQRMAEALDRRTWGTGAHAPGRDAPALPRPGEQPVAIDVSDDELKALIVAARDAETAGGGGGPA